MGWGPLQVSDRINCGVYIFSPEIFEAIKDAIDAQAKQST